MAFKIFQFSANLICLFLYYLYFLLSTLEPCIKHYINKELVLLVLSNDPRRKTKCESCLSKGQTEIQFLF